MSKTNKEIFGDDPTIRIQTGGRPEVDRDKVLQLLKAQIYTTAQIARAVDCHPKTIRRIRNELEEAGKLKNDEMKGRKVGATIEADFDEECQRATGMSFRTWVLNKFRNKSNAMSVFNFCRRCWSSPDVWDSPSLVRVKDRDDRLGDQLCQKWLEVFSDDESRIRDRKKQIRYLFRFLKRGDLNDAHLTMRRSQDPLAKRDVPEISMTHFPTAFQRCVDEMDEINPEWATLIMGKTIWLARTGGVKEQSGIYGITKQGDGGSWLIMEEHEDGSIEYRGNILDKGRIDWTINRFPPKFRRKFFDEVYQKTDSDEPFFKESYKGELSKTWRKITKKHIGREFKLHDLRKVASTWAFALGVPLEILAKINVGWKDLNTIGEHYLQIGDLLKKTERAPYAANIPDWFKEGMDDWVDDRSLYRR